MIRSYQTVPHRGLSRLQIAVLGGDGRLPTKVTSMLPKDAKIRHFGSRHHGGQGEARNLEQALQRGGIDGVFILARWNGHPVTCRIRRLCRLLGIPVRIVK